jgi:hypothetical protein
METGGQLPPLYLPVVVDDNHGGTETLSRARMASMNICGPEEHDGMETGRLHKVISVEHGGMETGPLWAPGGPAGGVPEEPGGMETEMIRLPDAYARYGSKETRWDGKEVGSTFAARCRGKHGGMETWGGWGPRPGHPHVRRKHGGMETHRPPGRDCLPLWVRGNTLWSDRIDEDMVVGWKLDGLQHGLSP